MIQPPFPLSEYLDPIRLKEGKHKCQACGRPMRGNGHELTSQLVEWMTIVDGYMKLKHVWEFDPRDVFKNVPRNEGFKVLAYNVPTDARYLGLLNRGSKRGYWKPSQMGLRFLNNGLAIPAKVWSFDGRIFEKDDALLRAEQCPPDWKSNYLHYVLDYIPVAYRTRIPYAEVAKDLGL